MHKFLFVFISLLYFPAVFAQVGDDLPQATVPDIPRTAPSAAGFVPDGWTIEWSHKADINKDGRDDLAIVLHQNNPSFIVKNDGFGPGTFDSNPRSFIVLFQQDDGDYLLVAQNHKIIPRRTHGNFDDAFDGIAFERGAVRLRIKFWASAGTWTMFNRTFIFRWQNDTMRLIGFEETNVHRGSGALSETSVNYLTGMMKTGVGNISNDIESIFWSELPRLGIISLGDLGNGYDFVPETAQPYSPAE